GWWQNGSVLGFLPYWWLGVAFVNPTFAEACARRFWPLAIARLALSAVLLLWHPPLAQALAEFRKLLFAAGIGLLIVAMDRSSWRALAPLAPIGRAGYGLYALHAPLTYTLVIYSTPWWAIVIANLMTCMIVHSVIERPLAARGRTLRQRLVAQPLAVPAEGT